jgi:catechol 2,3-dioxygenase
VIVASLALVEEHGTLAKFFSAMATSDVFFQSIQLSEVTLRVRDLERTRAFYEDLLRMQAVAVNPARVELAAGESVRAMIVLEHAPDAPQRPPGAAGLFHVAILYPSRAALGRMAGDLVKKRVAFGTGDHGVSEALYLDDPEGNGVELYADRALKDWPAAAADGQVTMYTEAVDLRSLLADGSGESDVAMPSETRIGHIHLSVSNLAGAEAFYGDVLGFPIRQRTYPGALFFGRDGYHHHFGANVWRSREPAIAGAAGLASFAVNFSDQAEWTKVLARAEAKGLAVTRSADTARVNDYDGIGVELRTVAAG